MVTFIRRFIFLFIIFSAAVFSQNKIEQAKLGIQKLTSKEFAGRGYAFNGGAKACSFLIERFKQIGLTEITKDYCQPFEIHANEIDGVPFLIINDYFWQPNE